MRLGERYVELFLFRVKLVFSVEAVFTFAIAFALLWVSSRISDMFGIATPSRMLHQIGLFVFFLTVILVVYTLGELVRRKFKLKSILFNDTSNNEVKQRIISLMQENPNIEVGEIADILGLYIGHTEDYIRKLEKSGLVKR